jgi:hypothetical protein
MRELTRTGPISDIRRTDQTQHIAELGGRGHGGQPVCAAGVKIPGPAAPGSVGA